MASVLLVGCGNIGFALLEKWMPVLGANITVLEPNPSSKLVDLVAENKVTLIHNLAGIKDVPEVTVLAIKPDQFRKMNSSLSVLSFESLIISVMAGITIDEMKKYWNKDSRIIRAMPNLASSVGNGITGMFSDANATKSDILQADELFSLLGKTEWLDNERTVNIVTALSGSGPAYVFLLTEALAEAGVEQGLTTEQAHEFAMATVIGSTELLKKHPYPKDLRDNVTSPGGTTEAAMQVLLSDYNMIAIVKSAVKASVKKSEEINGQM